MKRIAFVLSSFLLVSLAHAASFDCAKAGTKVEHIICDDPTISKLDETLNTKYKAALHNPRSALLAKQRQHFWLKQRDKCTNEGCVRISYENRIDELTDREKNINGIRARLEIPAFSKNKNPAFCGSLLHGLSNWEDITELSPIASADSIGDKKLQSYFGKCNPHRFITLTQIEPRIWDVLHMDSMPEEERDKYGTHFTMQEGFRLYQANIDNDSLGSKELILYGAGVLIEGADPADTSVNLSRFNVLDTQSCRISSSAQVQDVVNKIHSFVGLINFKNKNYLFDAEYFPRELSWMLTVRKWEYSAKTKLKYFAPVCTFIAKDEIKDQQ